TFFSQPGWPGAIGLQVNGHTWHPSTRFEGVSDRQNCRVITLLQPGSFNLDDEHAPVPTKVERPSKSQYTSFSILIHGWERSEEHTSELQSRFDLVCRLLLEKKKQNEDRI